MYMLELDKPGTYFTMFQAAGRIHTQSNKQLVFAQEAFLSWVAGRIIFEFTSEIGLMLRYIVIK